MKKINLDFYVLRKGSLILISDKVFSLLLALAMEIIITYSVINL